jgi:hypothetical protein
MKKGLMISICIIGMLFFNSCTTYMIPINSFKEQFSNIDSTKFKKVEVRGPVWERYNYLANPIQKIKCLDKKGIACELINSPSIEIRFTYGNKNKTAIYYFDRIYVNDSCVVGVQSRIISAIRKTIPLKTISKIEIQDGGKNFHYINE